MAGAHARESRGMLAIEGCGGIGENGIVYGPDAKDAMRYREVCQYGDNKIAWKKNTQVLKEKSSLTCCCGNTFFFFFFFFFW